MTLNRTISRIIENRDNSRFVFFLERLTNRIIANLYSITIFLNTFFIFILISFQINMITRINQIFRPVDWGQTANGERLTNLGFTIKEMKIYDQPSIRPNHFNTRGDNRLVNAIDMLNVSVLLLLQYYFSIFSLSLVKPKKEKAVHRLV